MRRLVILAMAIAILVPVKLPRAASDDPRLDEVERIANRELKTLGIPGAAIAFVADGRVAWARGFGVASAETNTPVTPDMLFRVGSMTKMVTALAVLVETKARRIPVDAAVGDYVQGLAPRIGRVTIAQLLSHTAGFKDVVVAAPLEEDSNEDDLLREVRSWKDDAMFFTEPGDVMSYSNLGFVLAGAFLEAITGHHYADVVGERVLRPVGMAHATFRPAMAVTHPFAQGHVGARGEAPVVVRPIKTDTRHWPAGFLWASANDYARLAIALMNRGAIDGRTVLDPDVVAAIEQPHVEMPGDAKVSYGFGLVVRGNEPTRELSHNGRMDGYGADLWMLPGANRAFVVMRNRLDTAPRQTMGALLKILSPSGVPLATPDATPAGLRLDELAGRYVNGQRTIVIAASDAGLTMIDDGYDGRPQRGTLKPVAANHLQFTRTDRETTGSVPVFVVRDRSGRVKYIATGERALRRQ
jgi:CubicO group peptidase (beta-lactamase class C family)